MKIEICHQGALYYIIFPNQGAIIVPLVLANDIWDTIVMLGIMKNAWVPLPSL